MLAAAASEESALAACAPEGARAHGRSWQWLRQRVGGLVGVHTSDVSAPAATLDSATLSRKNLELSQLVWYLVYPFSS